MGALTRSAYPPSAPCRRRAARARSRPRVIAVPVSVWLIAALAFNADYRADNIFALPDAAFSLLLLIAAALPTRPAVPTLITGFLFGAGVITVAALVLRRCCCDSSGSWKALASSIRHEATLPYFAATRSWLL
ncbi:MULTISPECIES: hypothetical protein [Nocardia]|uniref:hypothetical protein n=1 Tax=Nocardia TaxID=1817 RepID=UPI0024935FDA|nr:hypothetical protein [Nocardia sputorum]